MLPAEPLPASELAVPRLARIRRVRVEAPDVYTFELDPPDGAAAFAFAPGQFNMLYLFGQGEVAISISGDPGQPDRLVHTIRAVGSITRNLVRLKAGGTIGVRGPFGSPWPLDEARGRDVVVVAGGLGLAPLRPVLYHLASRRAEYGRIVVLYGTRTPRDLLFTRQFDQWRRQAGWQIQVTVDAAAGGWTGDVGVVTTLVPAAQFSPSDAVAFVCGPELMMRYTIRALLARGMTEDQIFLSMERNMKCGLGFCGHCQFGPTFVCRDGPVFRYDRLARWLGVREL